MADAQPDELQQGCVRRRAQSPQAASKRPRSTSIAGEARSGAAWRPPPLDVARKLPSAIRRCIAVDIDVNPWVDSRCIQGSAGRFGHDASMPQAGAGARLVRIGWAAFSGCGSISEATIKQRSARPVGFSSTERASTLHSIANSQAVHAGIDTSDMLEEFVCDVMECVYSGGRLVCPCLKFVTETVLAELRQCGMAHLARQWENAAKTGLCLMDQDIGRWARECASKDARTPSAVNDCMPISALVRTLLPDEDPCLRRSPSDGAVLYLKIAEALCNLILPPCQRGAAEHNVVAQFPQGMRDNGEYDLKCVRCGLIL